MDLTARRLVAAAGAASLLVQVVLLRELLALSQGNELVVGIVFGIWLCLTAGATALGARPTWSAEQATSALRLLLAVAPLLYVGSFAATALARPDDLGGAPTFTTVVVTAIVALVPASGVGGLAFAWALKVSEGRRHTRIYVAETVGAAAAGLLFHLVLADDIRPVWLLVIAGGCCATAAVLAKGRGTVAVSVAALAVASLLAPAVSRLVDASRFPGEHVLALRVSRYGQLAVLARGSQRAFLQDGVLLFTTEDQLSAEESVHLPMLLHPSARRVLMLGGGLQGGLVEILKHSPEAIDYSELDADLLGLAVEHGSPETKAALADSRVRVVPGDGRGLLRRAKRRYDVILVDAPVAQNALMARYSTVECFRDARAALAPGGLLAVVTPGSDTHLGDAARRRHGALFQALTSAFPFVSVAPGSPTILWAAEVAMTVDSATLASRLKSRELRLSQIGPTWLFDRLLPMHVAAYLREIEQARSENRDFRPAVYLFGLLETVQRIWPRGTRLALDLSTARQWPGILGLSLAVFLVLAMVRRRRGAPGLGVAAAGATGMALQICLVIAYQALRGHLFHALGLLLAGSMAGIAVGAWLAGRLADRASLVRALWGTAVVSCAVAALFAIAPSLPGLTSAAIAPSLSLVGAATGWVYPVAVKFAGPGAAARMYAWDLVGAAGAAFVVSLIAIPLFGLVFVAMGCAALCALAAATNSSLAGPSPSTASRA
jgi:spermidine synthase